MDTYAGTNQLEYAEYPGLGMSVYNEVKTTYTKKTIPKLDSYNWDV